MIQHIIEVTNGFNWGKFMLQKFDSEWSIQSEIDPGRPLLRALGWDNRVVLVTDLQTGEGAFFTPGGLASADLNQKHRVWVCPMFEPFLEWLYRQDLKDITRLPRMLTLSQEDTAKHSAMYGYRRGGCTREICKFCRRENPLGFSVPDDTWAAVAGEEYLHKVLCIVCFDHLATVKGIDWTNGPIEWFPVSGASFYQKGTEE